MHTPVSWRKRKRLTLKSHTVKTVMINKNIMANKKTVSMAWYLFSFSAAALSFSFSTSTVLVSVIAKINAKRAHNFTNSGDLFAAMLMPGWWQASIQATTVKAKGRERKGNEGLSGCCHAICWNCSLASVAKDTKDGHALEKAGPTFSSGYCSLMKLFVIVFITLQEHFVSEQKH